MGSMSSALGSAASGAGAGTFISPGLGTAIGAGLGFVGGLLGNSAQSKANKQNIALQRETNELNAKLARENYQLQRDLLERNLQYASPKEQRRMLEEAGYNPYDFVEGTGSKPVAATPTPQLPSMGSAQVQPVNAMASNLQQFGPQFAEMYRTIEEGKKAKAERKGAEIDNLTRYETALQQLRLMGQEEIAKKLENYYNEQSMEGRIESINLDNWLKEATTNLTKEQQVELAIRNKFAPYRNFWEVQNLVHTAKLLYEQGKTEITKQELNKAGVKKADAEALLAIIRQYYEPKVASSEIAKNQAESNYYNQSSSFVGAQAERYKYDTNFLKIHQMSEAVSLVNKLEAEREAFEQQGRYYGEQGIKTFYETEQYKRLMDTHKDIINETLRQLITHGEYQEAQEFMRALLPFSELPLVKP